MHLCSAASAPPLDDYKSGKARFPERASRWRQKPFYRGFVPIGIRTKTAYTVIKRKSAQKYDQARHELKQNHSANFSGNSIVRRIHTASYLQWSECGSCVRLTPQRWRVGLVGSFLKNGSSEKKKKADKVKVGGHTQG